VGIDADAPALQFVLEERRRGLVVEAGDDDAQDVDVPAPEVVDEFEGVRIVGDTEIGPYLLTFDIPGIDAQQDVGLVLELSNESHLDVGVVPRQDPGGMKIVEELPAEFQIQFVVEALDPLEDFPGLLFDIPFVVKTLMVSHGEVIVLSCRVEGTFLCLGPLSCPDPVGDYREKGHFCQAAGRDSCGPRRHA
jgi:hypothetical protein